MASLVKTSGLLGFLLESKPGHCVIVLGHNTMRQVTLTMLLCTKWCYVKQPTAREIGTISAGYLRYTTSHR